MAELYDDLEVNDRAVTLRQQAVEPVGAFEGGQRLPRRRVHALASRFQA